MHTANKFQADFIYPKVFIKKSVTVGGILVLTAPRGPDPGVLDFYPGVDRHSTMGNVRSCPRGPTPG